LGAPGARCSAGSSHAIANMLGTCVQLNCDYLDAVHGLVALAAARVMHCCRFVVIKKSRPMQAKRRCNVDSEARFKHLTRMTFGPHVWSWISRWIHVGNCQWLSEGGGCHGEAGEYLYSHQYLKTRILSPNGLRSRGAWRRRPPPQTYNEAICSGHL